MGLHYEMQVEWCERFKEFQTLIETQSKYKIKAFRCMSGGDFISREFEAFLMERGIESTPQYVGPAGCAIQSIVTMAKRMLEARKLEKSLWAERWQMRFTHLTDVQ